MLSSRLRIRFLLIAAVVGALVAGYLTGWFDRPTRQLLSPGQSPSDSPSATATSTPPPDPCAPRLAELSLRQQLAQLLMVGVGPAGADDPLSVLRTEQLGGIFIDGQAKRLLVKDGLAPWRAASTLPLMVAIDEEGGRVQRIKDLDGSIPSARVMAATMNTTQVRELARKRGAALKSHGITMDFAPDADVSAQPDEDVIGDRSFSSDPAIVTRYAKAFADGLLDAGISPVLKHFPGHGHAAGDTHKSEAVTPPLATMRNDDLVPYRTLAADSRFAVMVGHIVVPDLTAEQPASLSPAAYQLLRKDYGFTGVAITDDLGGMKAVTNQHPLPEAVLLALRAGADMALWSSHQQIGEVLDRLEQAVAGGELTRDRVTESVRRVLIAKSACS